MLISRATKCKARHWHGGQEVSLAELRRALAESSVLDNQHRRRLVDLARRVAHVRALGDEFAGVELSEFVTAAMERHAVVA
jgi:hypothetical protein